MGTHKHGVSGHFSPSPGYKMGRARDENRLAEEQRARRPKPETFATMRELMDHLNRWK